MGREVREAIKRIGGTLPENLPPAEHIKQVEKRIKQAPPKLELARPRRPRAYRGMISGQPPDRIPLGPMFCSLHPQLLDIILTGKIVGSMHDLEK